MITRAMLAAKQDEADRYLRSQHTHLLDRWQELAQRCSDAINSIGTDVEFDDNEYLSLLADFKGARAVEAALQDDGWTA